MVLEDSIQSTIETERSLLIDSGLSGSFWADSVMRANHISNSRCPSKVLKSDLEERQISVSFECETPRKINWNQQEI